MKRIEFIQKTLFGSAALMAPASLASAQQDRPAPIKLEIVKEFVIAGHGNFARVKEMLENDPLLLHVSNDWGGGDYESAIEGAGHVGNKEIANYLLSKGGRYNIYLACMMGNLELVKNVLGLQPQLLNSKGPHGFTLLHHAKQGGENSKPVFDYLQSLGAKEMKLDFYAKG